VTAASSSSPKLDLELRLKDPDGVFRRLVEAHRGLDAEKSADLNTRLVLLLANQLGQDALVLDAIAEARRQIDQRP
jgi:hypothetical protein